MVKTEYVNTGVTTFSRVFGLGLDLILSRTMPGLTTTVRLPYR